MIPAIIIGRGGSKGFPGKNKYNILVNCEWSPIMYFPIKAALNCNLVDYVYFSSDDFELRTIAASIGAITLDRDEKLATDEALAEDVFVDVYNKICLNYYDTDYYDTKEYIDLVVLMFANAPCVTSSMIASMIRVLNSIPEADSICTVSKYNAFSPYRSRKMISEYDGNCYLKPFCPDIVNESTCDRNSGQDNYIYDCSCAVIRPSCLNNISKGLPPQRWLGNYILPYYKKRDIPALDIDYKWQISQIKDWLEMYWEK